MAEMGMACCWKEYITSNMLVSHDMMSNVFYLSYPNEDCTIENIDPNKTILGKFQDLKHMVGIGILRKDMDSVVELFDWSIAYLSKLHYLVPSGQR